MNTGVQILSLSKNISNNNTSIIIITIELYETCCIDREIGSNYKQKHQIEQIKNQRMNKEKNIQFNYNLDNSYEKYIKQPKVLLTITPNVSLSGKSNI